MPEQIRLGIVGACGRGDSFRAVCQAHPLVKIAAVCDINEAELSRARHKWGTARQYTDYARMLDEADVNAIIIGTPMPLHVPQTIEALRRGMHVLCEVPAGVSVAECRELVLAARASKGVYMMAENYIYMKPNMIVAEMVRRGLFGTTYFAEAEYIHDLKSQNQATTWRRKWQTGINGNTYPTHSLGPILRWMPQDRVEKVCCAGSGHHYRDPQDQEYQNEDSTTTLCKMRGGGLVKLRLDMLSTRPHAITNYQLQGTDGCYESARAEGESDRIWLRSLSKDPNRWMKLDDLEKEFLPQMWRDSQEQARDAGHGGGDYLEIMDFVDAALGIRPPAIGIDAAMDMTLPGLISQQSIREEGRWLDVPDSRKWQLGEVAHTTPLHMVWPKGRAAPVVPIPPGYRLRQLGREEFEQCGALMVMAGFEGWDGKKIQGWHERILPGGYFVIEHIADGKIVATALAHHAPQPIHPNGGELGWVAGDPAHRGKGLGAAVCAAVVNLFLSRGYDSIYLMTNDFRLPAITVYLRLGFEPLYYADDQAGRWEKIRAALREGRKPTSKG